MVMAVVAEQGYRVNSQARSLRRQRADAVLAVVPDLGNPFFSEILAGIQGVLLGAGCDLLVTDNRSAHGTNRSIVSHLRAARVDGILCLDGSLSAEAQVDLASSDVRGRVVFACEWLPAGGYPSVRSDNRGGMALAVDHLAGLGHRRFAFLTGPAGNVLSHERLAGARAALARHGIGLPDAAILGGDFTFESGSRAAAGLLALAERPTAVVCSSDRLAIGLVTALEEQGISVPRDISVMGFDDIELASYARPRLSSIRQDRPALGRQAAELLLRRLASAEEDVPVLTLPVELVLRASTAPPAD